MYNNLWKSDVVHSGLQGSLTLENQHEGSTAEEQAFTANHKAACQQAMTQHQITCTRCKCQFCLEQKGGCAYHPGAMDFTCKHEGTPDERNIFDRYERCPRTFLDTPGEVLLHGVLSISNHSAASQLLRLKCV